MRGRQAIHRWAAQHYPLGPNEGISDADIIAVEFVANTYHDDGYNYRPAAIVRVRGGRQGTIHLDSLNGTIEGIVELALSGTQLEGTQRGAERLLVAACRNLCSYVTLLGSQIAPTPVTLLVHDGAEGTRRMLEGLE